MAVTRHRASLLQAAPNVRRKFRALVHVEHVAQQQFPQHRAAITLGRMKGDQSLVHAVVRHPIGPSVKAPPAFADVAGTFADDHTKSRRAAVKDHTLNDLFTPRTRA